MRMLFSMFFSWIRMVKLSCKLPRIRGGWRTWLKPAARNDEAFWFCGRCGTPNPQARYIAQCLGCGADRPASPAPATRRQPKRPRRRSRLATAVLLGCGSYAALILALWIFLSALGDRWWVATALLYGPRWFAGLPLLALTPAAVAWERRGLWALAAAFLLLIGPVMGFCVPWRTWLAKPSRMPRVRVLTCNVNYQNHHPEILFDLIATTDPDIVALQEWTPRHDDPTTKLGPGWQIHPDPGMCLLSRFPIKEADGLNREQLGGKGAAVHYVVDLPDGSLDFYNLHPISVREGLEAMIDYPVAAADDVRENLDIRWTEAEVASRWAGQARGRVLLAGDFNVPCDSPIYRHYWSGYTDAFSVAGLGFGHTWFSRWHGLRIDHVLAGPGWRCRRCFVGPDVGSDHRPIIADFEWTGAPQ